MNHQDPSVVLPMWRARRGVINTIACGVLGIAAAAAFSMFAVRVAVTPACTAYGRSHGMTYVDYKVYAKTQRASSACILASSSGATHSVSLPEAASYLTDLWVGVAFSPQISVPAFILLFAIARTRLASRDGRGGGTQRLPGGLGGPPQGPGNERLDRILDRDQGNRRRMDVVEMATPVQGIKDGPG
jgi:hypothetical protein